MGNLMESFCPCCNRNKSRINSRRSSLTTELLEEYKSSNLSIEMDKVSNIKELKIKNLLFIRESNFLPADVYQMVEYINQGSYGKVVKVKPFYLNEERAMKIIKKSSQYFNIKENDVYNEIKILKSLDHPNIIKIHEFFSDSINYYIVTEYCDEGDLHTRLSKVSCFIERVVRNMMRQILSCISYLHSKGIIHGDLKLENILIDSSRKNNLDTETTSGNSGSNSKDKYLDEYFDIKLIDFGCSKIFQKDEKLSILMGTTYYIAPEVLLNEYDEKSDLWSCGVIMYFLLSGRVPFSGEDDDEIIDKIKIGKYTFDYSEFKNVSKNAIDLIKQLICYDPKNRLSAKQALRHSWFASSDDYVDIDLSFSKTILNNLRNFNAEQKFQQAVVTYITHNLVKKNEVQHLRRIYKLLDKDQDGRISRKELKNGFRDYLGTVLGDIEVDNIFKSIDHDNNGYIEYEEFLRATVDRGLLLSESNLKLAFDIFDLDKNGTISVEEIKSVIGGGKHIPDNVFQDLLDEIDKKDDMSYQEFKEIMKKVVK